MSTSHYFFTQAMQWEAEGFNGAARFAEDFASVADELHAPIMRVCRQYLDVVDGCRWFGVDEPNLSDAFEARLRQAFDEMNAIAKGERDAA